MRMEGLAELASQQMKNQHFNCLSIGVISFKDHSYTSIDMMKNNSSDIHQKVKSPLVFDLASLTKPLTLGTIYLKYPDIFDSQLMSLLQHQAGIPAFGRLAHKSWKKQIESYPLHLASTEYSDFGALRLMLEIEKKVKKPFSSLVNELREHEIYFWKELELLSLTPHCPITGIRNNKLIQGIVHDDNAFVIDEFCTHAGLFASIKSLCQFLIYLDRNWNLLSKIYQEISLNQQLDRFVWGWDRVLDLEKTLAGKGAGHFTFGHLGFTGTSIWIDCEKKIGHVILTNATQKYWYERKELNHLRRTIGEYIWSHSSYPAKIKS